MTADELRAARQRLGMTVPALAAALNVPVKSLENWLGGRAKVPGPVERLVGMLLSAKTTSKPAKRHFSRN